MTFRSIKAALVLAVAVAALAAPATAWAKCAPKPADTVFTHGFVYTVDAHGTVARAVAVKDGKIVFVGTVRGVQAYIGPETHVVDLGGKMMLPGFIDAHAHESHTVDGLFSVLLYGMTSVQEYTQAVADFAAANPDMPAIKGQGWSNTVVPGIGPLATDLDAVVSDKPVAITSEDGHSLWCNTAALQLAGIDGNTPDPENGKIERVPGTAGTVGNLYGTPSGTLREPAATTLVTDKLADYTVDQYKQGILYFQDQIAAPLGITTVCDPMLRPGSNAVQAFEELAQAGQLTLRVRAALWLKPEDDLASWIASAKAERAKHHTAMFKITAVKFFADGVVEGHTAYLEQPYADAQSYAGDPTYRGLPLWTQKAMDQAFAAVDKAGFQIHVHAIGDAATRETLNALAYARKVNGVHDWRPGITHLQLVDPKDFKRFAELGVTAITDPYWFEKDDYYTNLQVPYLGQPRADHEYPMKSFFDHGVLVSAASDFPVTMPPAPIMGIGVGVTRWLPGYVWQYPAWPDPTGMLWPGQAVTVAQMIRAFTINGAKSDWLGRTTGSIAVGKSADLTVLDQNLFKISPDQIFNAQVVYTMGGGQVLFDPNSL